MQLTTINTAQHFLQAFSWMLIHSLWQGLLLSVIVMVLLTASKKASAAVRYNLVLMQLLLFVAACVGTFLWEWCKAPVQDAGLVFTASPAGDTTLSVKAFTNSCITYFTANSPVIVLLWFILFLVRTVRIMGSALYINRARHRFIYQPSDEWKARVALLCDKLQLKRAVQLLESGYVNVPMVIGHLKPVILIPIGLLVGLPAGQVEAVLLHELAHIRRNDYVVNCLQTIVETVFFFNPGLLWISSILRDERENCCDDIALGQTKNKKEFVQALISFKEYALERKSFAVNFPGEKNSLLNRASRILYDQNKPLGRGEKMFFLAGILVLSIVVATASLAEMHIAAIKHTQHANRLLLPPPFSEKASHPPIKFSKDTLVPKKLVYKSGQLADQHHEERSSNAANALRAITSVIATKQQNVNEVSAKQDILDRQSKKRDEESLKNNREAAIRDVASIKLNQDAAKLDAEAKARDQEAEKRDEEAKANNGDQVSSRRIDTKDPEKAKSEYTQILKEQAMRSQEQQQKFKDQEQAKRDAIQANRDQIQSKHDEIQAKIDKEQAIHDRAQADNDKAQAAKEYEKAKQAEKQLLKMQKEADMKTNASSDMHIQ